MITMLPISDNERKIIDDKSTEICKELHKIFPYCMISWYLKDDLKYQFNIDLIYQFNIDFIYLNVRDSVNVHIDYEIMLVGSPVALANFIYDRYILTKIERIKMGVNNED